MRNALWRISAARVRGGRSYPEFTDTKLSSLTTAMPVDGKLGTKKRLRCLSGLAFSSDPATGRDRARGRSFRSRTRANIWAHFGLCNLPPRDTGKQRDLWPPENAAVVFDIAAPSHRTLRSPEEPPPITQKPDMATSPDSIASLLSQAVDGTGFNSQGGSLRTSGRLSPARLTLQRVYDQSRQGAPAKDASKPLEAPPGPPGKGKPRLLLMGQRR